MLRIALRRVLISLPVLFIVTALTFVLVSFTPGDPAQTILGPGATPAQIAALDKQLGLHTSLWHQYVTWLSHFLHGNLGSSLLNGQSVSSLLNGRIVVSLSLIVGATIVTGVIGVGLGLLSALRGGWLGKALDALSLLGVAIPNFWLALILAAVFAVSIRLFPATGYVPFSASPGGWARALVLPVVALAFGGVALIAKQTRDSMLDVLGRDFVRVMQANGFSRRSIIYRHALRNASLPVVTLLGVVFASMIGGTLLVESVFALPGLASIAVSSTIQHDIPVIQGVVVYFTIAVIVVNLLVDLAYAWLDPRVRLG